MELYAPEATYPGLQVFRYLVHNTQGTLIHFLPGAATSEREGK